MLFYNLLSRHCELNILIRRIFLFLLSIFKIFRLLLGNLFENTFFEFSINVLCELWITCGINWFITGSLLFLFLLFFLFSNSYLFLYIKNLKVFLHINFLKYIKWNSACCSHCLIFKAWLLSSNAKILWKTLNLLE